MLSNTSDNTREAGIWHSSVLLSADAETVTVHEPFSDERGRERTMSKQQFIDHWGQAYMRGYLLVADPSNS